MSKQNQYHDVIVINCVASRNGHRHMESQDVRLTENQTNIFLDWLEPNIEQLTRKKQGQISFDALPDTGLPRSWDFQVRKQGAGDRHAKIVLTAPRPKQATSSCAGQDYWGALLNETQVRFSTGLNEEQRYVLDRACNAIKRLNKECPEFLPGLLLSGVLNEVADLADDGFERQMFKAAREVVLAKVDSAETTNISPRAKSNGLLARVGGWFGG